MRIIDLCCGVGPWRNRDPLLPYSAAQLLELLEHFGIDSALVYARLTGESGSIEDGQAIVREATDYSPRFLPTISLDNCPHRDAKAVNERNLRESGAKIAWYHPPAGVKPSPWMYEEIADFSAQRRLPWLIELGRWAPDDIHQLCAAFPTLRVILTGLDYRGEEWLYPLLARHDELRACLAPRFITPLGVERFVARFGVSRLLFGSGLPESSPGGLIGYVMYSDISDDEKAAILGGNAETLLREVELCAAR